MGTKRTAPAGLVPVGFQTMSISNSTAVAANSTTRGARVLHISVETQAARYRADGTAPTRNTGVLLATGTHWLEGYNGTANLRFHRSTGTSKISIMGYKHKGD